jgi:hypothetical protein
VGSINDAPTTIGLKEDADMQIRPVPDRTASVVATPEHGAEYSTSAREIAHTFLAASRRGNRQTSSLWNPGLVQPADRAAPRDILNRGFNRILRDVRTTEGEKALASLGKSIGTAFTGRLDPTIAMQMVMRVIVRQVPGPPGFVLATASLEAFRACDGLLHPASRNLLTATFRAINRSDVVTEDERALTRAAIRLTASAVDDRTARKVGLEMLERLQKLGSSRQVWSEAANGIAGAG